MRAASSNLPDSSGQAERSRAKVGGKNCSASSNPAAPSSERRECLCACMTSKMSLGWFTSLRSAVMEDRTPFCVPDMMSDSSLELRKWSYSARCSGDRRTHTTCCSLGGRCLDSSVLVRRSTNLLSSDDSSRVASSPAALTRSLAHGSRDSWMGPAKRRRKAAASPRMPGLVKSIMANSSSRSFCTGVPDRRTRRRHARPASACVVSVRSFFSRCASSQMSRSQESARSWKRGAWMRNVSYEMMSTW